MTRAAGRAAASRRPGSRVGDVSQEASEDVPKGRVIAQDPDPLSTLPPGDPVDLTVSTGQPDVVVPDILGDDKDTARQKLTDAGLRVKLVEEAVRRGPGHRDRQRPAARRPACPRAAWSRSSTPPGPRRCRAWSGSRRARRASKLEKAGFKVDTVYDSHDRGREGHRAQAEPGGVHHPAAGHHGGDHGVDLREADARPPRRPRPRRRRPRRRRPRRRRRARRRPRRPTPAAGPSRASGRCRRSPVCAAAGRAYSRSVEPV